MAGRDLKQLTQLQYPVVLSGKIEDWPASKWTPENLGEVLGEDRLLRWRIGPKDYDDGVLWEGRCCYEEATIAHFQEWQLGSTSASNPLHKYNSDIYWCYMDYKHMPDLFPENVLKMIDWSPLGCDGRDGKQSTFWIGSPAAHTPCHYDTYGCNLVAQIYGRKRWVLFPPSDTRCLYPTRIPYEESSVFSDVNITHPDLNKHPEFKHSRPYVVTLEPGQVLYVPHHWWHHVECLDTAITINSWIEMDGDDENRLEEAITRLMVMTFMGQNDLEKKSSSPDWLNPTEEYTSHAVNCMYISQVLKMLKPVNTEQASLTLDGGGGCEQCRKNTCLTVEGNDAQTGTSCKCDHEVTRKRCRRDESRQENSTNLNRGSVPFGGGADINFASRCPGDGHSRSELDKQLTEAADVKSCTFQEYLNVIGYCGAGIDSAAKSTRDHDVEAASLHPRYEKQDGLTQNISSSHMTYECRSCDLKSCSSTSTGLSEPKLCRGQRPACEVNSATDPPQTQEAPSGTETSDSASVAKGNRTDKEIGMDTLVNCFTHPHVIRMVADLLKSRTKYV